MEKISQKIYSCYIEQLGKTESKELSEINGFLEEGFEVIDIVSVQEKKGGAIFNRTAGLYNDRLIFVFDKTGRTSSLHHHYIKRQTDYLDQLEKTISLENELGYKLIKAIPYNAIFDPAAQQGIGNGTVGLVTFFVADNQNVEA